MPNFQPVITEPQYWDAGPPDGWQWRPRPRRVFSFKPVGDITADEVAQARLKAINHRGATGNQYNTQNGFEYNPDLDAYRANIAAWEAKKMEMTQQDYTACYMALMEEYSAGLGEGAHLDDAYRDIGLGDMAIDSGDAAGDLQTQYSYYLQADSDYSSADLALQQAHADHNACHTAAFTAAGILANYP
jgi:hypothetical protein